MAIEFYCGKVADTAATFEDEVRVSVPDLTRFDRSTYGPLTWTPNIDSNGDPVLPQRGDNAFIGVDMINGHEWIVCWRST